MWFVQMSHRRFANATRVLLFTSDRWRLDSMKMNQITATYFIILHT